MPLPSRVEYNDLSGKETLEILHARLYDFLTQIPMLQERFALTRVIMKVELSLDIWGATPPHQTHNDMLIVESSQTVQSATVDSRDNPPDQVRSDYGLPLPRAMKSLTPFHETGHEPSPVEPTIPPAPPPKPVSELPANKANPNVKKDGRRTYAGWITQDYGSLQAHERSGSEGPVIGGDKYTSSGGDHAPVQADFMLADHKNIDPNSERASKILDGVLNRAKTTEEQLNANERIFSTPEQGEDNEG